MGSPWLKFSKYIGQGYPYPFKEKFIADLDELEHEKNAVKMSTIFFLNESFPNSRTNFQINKFK